MSRPAAAPRLRVLIANERADHLETLAKVVEALGHNVVARTTSVSDVAAVTAAERPDVALVGLGDNSAHALELVAEIVREAYCPVIAILGSFDAEWVKQAAACGVYSYISDGQSGELQGAIEIALRRFADVRSLQSAIERRNAEALRELAHTNTRLREALELHDGVVQGLVTAQLAHDLGHGDDSRSAIAATLEQAKAVVTRSLEELSKTGRSTEAMIGDAAPDAADG